MPVFENFKQFMAIASTGLDFQTLVEAGYRQPIAFKDRQALLDWALSLVDFEPWPIGRRSLDNIMVVNGCLNFKNEARFYRQVWVRAGYKSYRRAMLNYYSEVTGASRMDRYDIDHAVSRKTLAHDWPEAWVNLLYVESGINRSIGALMERETRRDLVNTSAVIFNAECYLKLFHDRLGKLSGLQIGQYMHQASSRFLTTSEQGATLAEIANVHHILGEIFSEAGCSYEF